MGMTGTYMRQKCIFVFHQFSEIMSFRNAFSIFCLLIITSFSAVGQEQEKESKKSSFEFPEPSVTSHSITLNGKKLNYTATAGHLLMYDDKGIEKAKIFYIAYVKDGVEQPSSRPVTFSFNGGPGSSSVWLHMGALGPKRVLMTEEGLNTPPPFELVENQYSWLDETDLVFIDPVETGFSRPATDVEKKEFTGYDEDIKSVGDFIHRYITRNSRWNSPKYLVGESYGTTRAAGLSGYLQDRHGMYLNGIVLISAVMNFQTLAFSTGNDLPYVLFLPGFAATAYHHGKTDQTRFPDFDAFLQEVEDFASTEYMTALMKGDQLTESEREMLAGQLSSFTGLSADFIESHHFRIDTRSFTKELLRDENKTVGRFDGLVTGIDFKPAGTGYDYDPSYYRSVYGAYTMAINDHLKRELKFDNTDLVYEILTGNVHPWNYGRASNRFLDNSHILRNAIHKNPHLKVLVCNGYYDLATPYFATEYTINHMFVNEVLRENITMKYYHGGHMMYTLESELNKLTMDVREFYKSR